MEQSCCNTVRPGAWLDIWVIFNLLQLFLLYFYNLYTRSEYQDYLDILESVVRTISLLSRKAL